MKKKKTNYGALEFTEEELQPEGFTERAAYMQEMLNARHSAINKKLGRQPLAARISRRGRPPALTTGQVDEACRLHLAGLKDPAIAIRFGVCAAVISKARRGKGAYNGHRA